VRAGPGVHILACVRGSGLLTHAAIAVLTQLNDGKAVADDLVDEVMLEADGTADGRVSKLELGRAIAVWYAQQLPSGLCLPPHLSLHLARHQNSSRHRLWEQKACTT
jgi:hypothetical protein